ncbi:DNA-directed DNA polymerase epsilon, subunit B [Ancistrocladus abbreviatus]
MGVTRKEVQKHFKIRGYTLRVDALEEVLSFVNRFEGAEEEAINLLLDELDNEPLKSSILDKDPIHHVVTLLLKAESADGESPNSSLSTARSAISFIDAFIIPRFRYDSIRKVFYEDTRRLPIHGNASAKGALYRDRYELLFQRLSRDPHFSEPAFETEMSTFGCCEIVPIQSLSWKTGRRWIMGVISQLEDGHFYLEDLSASVEIDLSNAKITTGFFTENTIIVAEGERLPDGVFKVNTCGFPPVEDREGSLSFLSGLDFFGSGTLTKEEMKRLEAMEKKAVNEMFVFLSDVWLDDEQTMGKLAAVFDGYESVEVVPSLFVLMGNFCSRPCNLSFHSFSGLRLCFGKLGKMIGDHPRLKEHSRFLFVPGPDDIGPSTSLPRCALPKYLSQELQEHVPNALFLSNPCRIKFYNQEIVVFRQDLLYRMRRSCLLPPSTDETSDPFGHLVATVIHQSHLCPLPLTVQPVIWNYDHCLHLYPTPHTIVLGDRSEQKVFKYAGATCFNPGSFSNESNFVAYRPCTREVELSAL